MVKKKAVPVEQRRTSPRLASKPVRPAADAKKKPVAKKAAKAKKTKLSENGSTKAEEPKAEATEANWITVDVLTLCTWWLYSFKLVFFTKFYITNVIYRFVLGLHLM